jgi:hypothetical protein
MIAVNGSVIQGLAQCDFDVFLTSGDATKLCQQQDEVVYKGRDHSHFAGQ